MIVFRAFIIALIAAAAGGTVQMPAQGSLGPEERAFADFARRVNAYLDTKAAAASTVLPLVPLSDAAELRQRTEALASVNQSARWGARQGDLFTPEIAQAIRVALRRSCDGDYATLLAIAREELTAPLPEPVVHGRWPATAPVPTMLPGVLAALPALPVGLQYRFMNQHLVLLDIDANLILDFVVDAMPITTEIDHAE
jgi:hypothetical protein